MNINFGIKKDERKSLAEAIGKTLSCEPVYQGVPSFSYTMGEYELTKEGTLIAPDEDENGATRDLLDSLASLYGFHQISPETAPCGAEAAEDCAKETACAEALTNPAEEAAPTEELAEQTQEEEKADEGDFIPEESTPSEPDLLPEESLESPDDSPITYVVFMPRELLTPEVTSRLGKLINSKRTVLQHALGVEDLKLEESRDKEFIGFPWFIVKGIEGEADAYGHFVRALIDYATEHKHIKAEELKTDNEKYVMRMFLIKLGLKGEEHKTLRKILMQNLKGNASWPGGSEPEHIKAKRLATRKKAKPEDSASIDDNDAGGKEEE